MKILSFNYTTPQYTPSFRAKISVPKAVMNSQPAQDIVEISHTLNNNSPLKLELTELEEKFYELFKKIYGLNFNIKTQKENLKYYYSTENKAAYQSLLRERQKMYNKLKHLAKKENVDAYSVEYDIKVKKEYNRYAPKICRSKTKEELKQVEQRIATASLRVVTEDLLKKLAEEQRKTLK